MSWQYDYWYVENYYSVKERKKISEYIENNHTDIEKPDAVAMDKNNASKKKANTLLIEWGKIKNMLGNLESSVHSYNQHNFGYLLSPFNNLSKCLLNVYDSKKKSEYGWHYDASRSDIYDVKLTVLVNLSDKYKGGKFCIFNGEEHVVEEFKPGTLLLFKSYINHKVTPVLSGVRKTLTLLATGPKLR